MTDDTLDLDAILARAGHCGGSYYVVTDHEAAEYPCPFCGGWIPVHEDQTGRGHFLEAHDHARTDVPALVARVRELEEATLREDGLCPYCGEMTDSTAGNPGQWPLHFSQSSTGIVRAHHTDCVTTRLADRDQAVSVAAELREAIAAVVQRYDVGANYGEIVAAITDLAALTATPVPNQGG